MKKTVKILAMVMIAILLVSIASSVFAINPTNITGNTSGTTGIQGLGSQVIGFIQVIGSITAVAVLVILGVKYMMGSAEEKAEYKKTMIPYIIGAILVFAASNIAGFFYSFATSIGNSTNK